MALSSASEDLRPLGGGESGDVAFWGESHRSGELAAVAVAGAAGIILPVVVVVVRLLCSSSHKLAGDQIPLALGLVLRLSGVSGAGCCGPIDRHLPFACASVLFFHKLEIAFFFVNLSIVDLFFLFVVF